MMRSSADGGNLRSLLVIDPGVDDVSLRGSTGTPGDAEEKQREGGKVSEKPT